MDLFKCKGLTPKVLTGTHQFFIVKKSFWAICGHLWVLGSFSFCQSSEMNQAYKSIKIMGYMSKDLLADLNIFES